MHTTDRTQISAHIWHEANPSTGYRRFGNQYSVATGPRTSQKDISEANSQAAIKFHLDKHHIVLRLGPRTSQKDISQANSQATAYEMPRDGSGQICKRCA